MQGQVNPESWTHGSAANRQKWLNIGFTTGDPNKCNDLPRAALWPAGPQLGAIVGQDGRGRRAALPGRTNGGVRGDSGDNRASVVVVPGPQGVVGAT